MLWEPFAVQRSRQSVGQPWMGWLGWEPSGSCRPGCVRSAVACARCQNKSQTRLGAQERCGCFSKEMRNHFTILDWLEKWRAILRSSISSDLLVRCEISGCPRESSTSCHPRSCVAFSSACSPVKVSVKVSVKANPNLADRIIAFRPSAPLQEWGDGGIWSQLQLLCILHAGPGE